MAGQRFPKTMRHKHSGLTLTRAQWADHIITSLVNPKGRVDRKAIRELLGKRLHEGMSFAKAYAYVVEGLQTGVYPGERSRAKKGVAQLAKIREEQRQQDIQALHEAIPGSRFETSRLTKKRAMMEFKKGETVTGIAFRWCISAWTVTNLLEDDPEFRRLQALRVAFHRENSRFPNERYWLYKGKRYSTIELAALAECNVSAMWQRLVNRHWTPEEAVAAGSKAPQPGHHRLDGKRTTAAELAALAGCSVSAMNGRIWRGMTPEEAVAAGERMPNPATSTRPRRTTARAIKTPKGVFSSGVAAAEHYRVTPAAIIWRIKHMPGWSYVDTTSPPPALRNCHRNHW